MAQNALVALYEDRARSVREVIGRIVPEAEVEALVAEAREAFVSLVEEIPYADRRDHVMFDSAFGVFQWLAVYQAARGRGIDAHRLGRSILALKLPGLPGPPPPAVLEKLRREAEESQRAAGPAEFVFEIVEGDGGDTDWGIDISACAVCHAFGRHDAMDLVPYMCASDDVQSDAADQGLRRSGTIALGSHRCDFRYKHGGEARRLAPQYPEQIRLERGGS